MDQSQVALRAVTPADADWLARMRVDPFAVGPHNYSGETDSAAVTATLLEQIPSVVNSALVGWLVVELTGGQSGSTPIGDVSWRTERWGPSPESACPAIGIALLPAYRGRGYGTAAQRLLVDHLFREFDVHRIQSDTAVDNPAEQRSLERVGFTREGLVREAEFRDGRYHDHVLYSVLRAEWTLPD